MRILVPLDGTPESETAIPVAGQLATALDAEIFLVGVLETSDAGTPFSPDPGSEGIMERIATYLGDRVSAYDLPTERTLCVVEQSDDAARQVVAMTKREAIDLVVMASGCQGWLQRLAQGGLCDRVRGCKVCPVLSVPLSAPMPAEDVARRQPGQAAPVPDKWSGRRRR
jgi:nucleotide-binding universal stress UspA family protein